MICRAHQKSSLAAVNIQDQATIVGDVVEFSTNRVHTGLSIVHVPGGNTVTLAKPGLYLVSFDGDFTITATGPVTAQLLANGVVVAGAENTVQATADEPVGLHFTTVVNVLPSCCAVNNTTNLQVSISAEGVLNNANLTVVKEA